MRPRIGITTSFEDGEQRLHHAYVDAVAEAGGLPLIVPMLTEDEALHAFADLLDALVIVGGPAVTDGLIGTLPADISPTDPRRVRADRRILAAFLESQRPVLGICYGMQLLNAEAGGTIYADVEAQVAGASVHSSRRGGTSHPLHIRPGTHLHAVLGADTLEVNTRHIQAVAEVGAGYRVAATSPDGVIEAIENETGTVLGMQFHPERMGDAMRPLFNHFVAHAQHPVSP